MENTKITFIGHSTTLIEGNGVAVLTDPNFSPNIFFLKRKEKLKYNPGQLPELSAVIISHTHFDHLDNPSFNYIRTSVPIVVPEDSGRAATRFLPNPVIELAHWAKHEFGNSLKIHAMPASHASNILCPVHYKNACSYVIEISGKKIFFAGDTSYHSRFRDIGNMYQLDAALLPIACYRPAFFMKRFHMDPLDSVQAFLDLKAKIMIPIHWGSFRLSFEKLDEPVEWLKKIAAERSLEDHIKILNSGQSVEV